MSPSASLTIKASAFDCALLQWWGFNQAAGWQQNIFQEGHDTTRNIRIGVTASEIDQRANEKAPLMVPAQQTMLVSIAGSATTGDVEQGCFLALYRDGISANMMSLASLKKYRRHQTTVQATLTGAAAGVTGIESITAESDLLKANTIYAVVGMTTSIDCLAVLLSGIDFANTYIGVPGDAADNDNTVNYFTRLAEEFDAPLIPWFNSANKGSMNLAFVQNENNISPLVTLYLVDCGPAKDFRS